MGIGIISAIGSLLLCIIGLWKYFARKARYKREKADEAKKKLDGAVDGGDTSVITSAFDTIGRLR